MINHVQQFPGLFGGVKSIQSGIIDATTTGDTYAVTINAVDPNNSIAFFYGGSGSAALEKLSYNTSSRKYFPVVTAATTLTLRTIQGPGTAEVILGAWFVVEFHKTTPYNSLKKSGTIKSIQSGYAEDQNKTGTTSFGVFGWYKDITISAVAAANCLVLVEGLCSNGTSNGLRRAWKASTQGYEVVPELTSSTNLRLHSDGYLGGTEKYSYVWTVIEFDL